MITLEYNSVAKDTVQRCVATVENEELKTFLSELINKTREI